MNIEESSQRLNNLVQFWKKQIQRPSFSTIDEDDIEAIKCLLTENKKLKEELKATRKGLNKVLSKRKKWKDRYYKERLKKRNFKKWLEYEISRYDNSNKIGFHFGRCNTLEEVLREIERI